MPNTSCIARRDPDYIHVRYASLSRKATALVIAQHDLETLSALMGLLVEGVEAGRSATDMAGDLADAKAALALVTDRKNGNQARQKGYAA